MTNPKPLARLPGTEVLEEAFALLRRTPASTLLCSLTGNAPFWLALLYFVADMGNNAFAADRLIGASLTLALLYLWKKSWQTVFCAGLYRELSVDSAEPWDLRRVVRMVLTQASIQYWGLLVRVLLYNLIIPTAWISAFYQSATVLGDGRKGEEKLSARAWAQASLWPGSNHMVVSSLAFFWFAVWVNVAILGAGVPTLLKTFLGIETAASRNLEAFMFNGTFVLATVAGAFILVDPIWKAAYVVRCFHGTSLQSGADLRASLRSLRKRATVFAALALLAGSGFATGALKSEPAPMRSAPAQVDPDTLDHAIEQTLERREYAWRFRRVAEPTKTSGWFQRFLEALKRWLERMMEKLADLLRWLVRKITPRKFSAHGSETVPIPELQSVLYGAGAIALVLLAWAGWWFYRRPRTKVIQAEGVTPLPDLQAADVTADQLPEDGWLAMARDLVSRGELRLALRAAYLASLAHLGQHEFVSIARHKSNRDYQRELRRRARSREELLAAFDENLLAFERAWYGDHGVTMPIFERFTQNLERIRAC